MSSARSIYHKYTNCPTCAVEITVQSLKAHLRSHKMGRLSRTCAVCGNHTTNKKYCSIKCSGVDHTVKQKTYTCNHCSNTVISNRKVKFCSYECTHANQQVVEQRKFDEGMLTHSPTLRKHLAKLYGYRCNHCGLTDWRGKFIQLELEHIDGNPDNNTPSNLELLCLNCHSQTPTFRRRNIGKHKSDRRSRVRRKMYSTKLVADLGV